jgi:hypothetical protein
MREMLEGRNFILKSLLGKILTLIPISILISSISVNLFSSKRNKLKKRKMTLSTISWFRKWGLSITTL